MTETPAREVVEAVYAALRAGDRPALLGILSPDVVAHFSAGLPLGIGGTHRGADAVIANGWWAIGRAFDVTARPERWMEDGPGTVVVTGTYHGTARATGRPLSVGFAHTWTLVDGKIAELVQVTDAAAWRDALDPAQPASVPETDPIGFRYDDRTGIARIELISPKTHNRIDPAFVYGFHRAVDQCDTVGARVVLISAAGSNFTVGGDLGHIAGNLDTLPDALDTMIGPYHGALHELGALSCPVVCAVQGAAAGGGLGLLWASDVVLAADDLQLTTGFAKLGLSGDGGSSWALPRLVGLRRALRLSFDSLILDAEACLAEGLVDQVVPAGELAATALATAERLAAGPTVAFGHMRRLLRTATERSWPDQLAAERTAIVDCARTPDAREGLAAFLDRRPPAFGKDR